MLVVPRQTAFTSSAVLTASRRLQHFQFRQAITPLQPRYSGSYPRRPYSLPLCTATPRPSSSSSPSSSSTPDSGSKQTPYSTSQSSELPPPPPPPPSPPEPESPSGTILRDELINVPSSSGPVPVRLKVESLAPRRLRVSGSVRVQAATQRLWRVLTAYPLQRAFIPNLISTTPLRRDGRLFLEQVGLLSRKLRLQSKLILAVNEDWDARTIRLSRDSGRDFVEFDATYVVRELSPASESEGSDTSDTTVVTSDEGVILDYQIVASPFALYPMSLVEGKIIKEVPRMLVAVREEAMIPTHVPNDDLSPRTSL